MIHKAFLGETGKSLISEFFFTYISNYID